jgi:hypothetical protein
VIINIIKLIENKSTKTKPIYFSLDVLGTEEIIFKISQHFKSKFYLDEENMKKKRFIQLKNFKFLENYFTNEKSETKFRIISFSTMKSMNLILENEKNEKDYPIFIKCSTMWIKFLYNKTNGLSKTPQELENNKNGDSYTFDNGIYYFLFSNHSSFIEIKKFVNSIKPKFIKSLINDEEINKNIFLSLFFKNEILLKKFIKKINLFFKKNKF